jgi:predicted acyltransferase
MIDDVAKKNQRLISLDALRGFDMFWIIGGAYIFRPLEKISDGAFVQGFCEQLHHVQWEGFRFYDLIMPLFLFMIGTALPFSVTKRLERGESKVTLYKHIIKRVIILVFLGMIVNGKLLSFTPSEMHLSYSVLQVLAVGYLVASFILLNFKPKAQIIITAAMLLTFWALMAWWPVPGFGRGDYSVEGNFGAYLNNLILGDLQTRWKGVPWILNILTHGSTAMLGVFAGQILRSSKENNKKLLSLVSLGAFCLLAGWLMSFSHPIIKKAWTSSFALWAGGFSYLILALFFFIIDMKGYKKWAFPFVVIGMNSIFIYMAASLFKFRLVADVLVKGLAQYVGPWYPSIQAFTALLIMWLILYYMYKKRTFVKI